MTPSGPWLEEEGFGRTRISAPKSDPNEAPMSAVKPALSARGRIADQVPAFAAIGLFGYFVDATITYVCAKYLGLSPELARPPGFLVATIVNFALNRSITFRHSQAPLFRAFVRYCGVAAVGLAVNYSVYSVCVVLAPRVGVVVTPAILPLFVAAGSGAAMVLTFVGFRFFAFRS
jgi:putative flippase GtrA